MKRNVIEDAKIVLNVMNEMVQSALNKARFNQKKRAVVQSINDDGTANILINGIVYNNIPVRDGLTLTNNNIVWVELPNGNMDDAYVDYKIS